MPRPLQADGEKTRLRILDRAAQLFADHGPDGASVRDIARACDLSVAMVSHYFGSKEALYDACVDAMYAELTTMGGDLVRGLGTVPAQDLDSLVARAVRIGFRFARQHQRAVRLLLREVIAVGELDARRRERVQRPFLDEVSRLVGAALGRPARTLRLPLQSVIALTARYAASSERELELFAGNKRAALRAVEDHLVAVARALLSTPTNQ